MSYTIKVTRQFSLSQFATREFKRSRVFFFLVKEHFQMLQEPVRHVVLVDISLMKLPRAVRLVPQDVVHISES